MQTHPVQPARPWLGGFTCWAARGRRHYRGTVSTVAVGSGSIPDCGVWGVWGVGEEASESSCRVLSIRTSNTMPGNPSMVELCL